MYCEMELTRGVLKKLWNPKFVLRRIIEPSNHEVCIVEKGIPKIRLPEEELVLFTTDAERL